MSALPILNSGSCEPFKAAVHGLKPPPESEGKAEQPSAVDDREAA
jgi:hypothetical protein